MDNIQTRKITVASVWVCRILVGAVFILSGTTKMIDPYGFIYKIQQYLAVWGWDVPGPLVVMSAVGLSGLEFLCGLALATGSYKHVSVWAISAIMAVMLPLSIYIAIVNPVADCGCFGDFLILSNTVTCIKNIVIVAAVIWLWRYNAKVRGLYMPYIQWIELTIGGAYMLIVGLIGYHEQPLLDFRQYKIGTKLMNNAAPDIKFIYEKDGSRQSFSIAELPDSTWTYIDRIEPETVHSELALYDMASDEEVTDDVATTLDSGDAFILLIQDLKKAGVANTYILNELNSYITSRGGIMFALVDAKSDDVAEWIDLAMAEYPIYKTEATSIKEIARGNMSVVYCHNGIIVWKRTLWSIGTELFQAHNSSEWLTESRPISGTRIFWCLTLICGGLLFILWAASKSAIGLHHRFIASHGYGINKASENQSE